MRIVAVLLLAFALQAEPAFRAGAARVKITPALPVWLAGYALRDHPADSVLMDLYAKALAIDDGKRGRIIIITTDLVGLPREVSDPAAARIQKTLGLQRSLILFNSSHTHTGPVVWPNLKVMLDLTEEQQRPLRAYAERLTTALVTVAVEAARAEVPARLSYSEGEAGFAINRRAEHLKSLGVDAPAPVDHAVPVIRVERRDGSVLAVLFGYACHNTTLTAAFYEVSGDYAGYAQAAIERAHPGAIALFMMLCGGDQNPDPRSKHELAVQHGEALADAVELAMQTARRPLTGPVKTVYKTIDLSFAPHTRQQFEEESHNSDIFRQRRARLMLETYDRGRPIQSITYPIQVVRFGGATLIALGGEVVVDYALRLKREFRQEPLIVAGYSNVVMSYIPSLRVLKEGGYEAEDAMIYYALPGRYTEDVEERIISAVHEALARAGVRSSASTHPALCTSPCRAAFQAAADF